MTIPFFRRGVSAFFYLGPPTAGGAVGGAGGPEQGGGGGAGGVPGPGGILPSRGPPQPTDAPPAGGNLPRSDHLLHGGPGQQNNEGFEGRHCLQSKPNVLFLKTDSKFLASVYWLICHI